MAKKIINTGTTDNDGTGDSLKAGAGKINDNFSEIYTAFGDGTNLTGGTLGGAQGIKGNVGSQGISGSFSGQGVQGLSNQGTQGLQGSVGAQGTQGVQGRDGTNAGQGAQGTIGAQGLSGNQGVQGKLGIQGPLGIQGDLGAYGPQGVQGNLGYGAQGFQGIIGGTGSQGTFGQIGPAGNAGPQGVQGLQGLTGQGIQGNLGIQGGGGPAGNTGAQGAIGIQGTQGVQGIQGVQGLQGIQGVQGHQGLQGVQGLSHQGTQGLVGQTGQDGSGVNYWQNIPGTGLSTSTSVIISGSVGIGTTALDTGLDLIRDNTAVLSAGIGSFSRSWSAYWDGFNATYDLGADGTNHYTFTGKGLIGAENDPELTLMRGQKYSFRNEMGAHPFRIQSTPNGSVGTAYTDGIINNDVSNGVLYWDIQFDAPNTLYYQCTAHPNMGGRINIVNSTRTREEVSNSTGSIGAGTTTDITITGYKSYALQKIGVDNASWVRVYTDAASRTADASRPYGTPASPGSGLIAEGRSTVTGISTFKMTPGVIGWNDNETPNEDIYLKVTNNESGSADITVTLTILRMEE